MNYRSIENIKENGFDGFYSVSELWSNPTVISNEPGVYVVLLPMTVSKPKFINPGVGGFFKGKNPNISLEELKSNWINDTIVVYIGKAGSASGKATLRSRISQYLKFGQGKNIGHWGGRLIWQLADNSELLFCWKETPNRDPREIERIMIEDFVKEFGSRPFANLSG